MKVRQLTAMMVTHSMRQALDHVLHQSLVIFGVPDLQPRDEKPEHDKLLLA